MAEGQDYFPGGDSGFYRQKMLNWCDKNEVKYIVGLAENSRLLELSRVLQMKAEVLYNETHEKTKLCAEFQYAAGTWKYPRRVIAKAEFNSLGPNNRFIVTNLDDDDGQYLYEKVYCVRGETENRIKEQQLVLFADRTSCHDFAANQFRLLIASLAYILMERFRTLLLSGTKFAEATCGSIRLYMVKIGAVIRRNTRKIYIALSSACPNQELLRLIAAKIIAME